MAGPTEQVIAGSGWTQVLAARGREALAEIDAYGPVEIAVADGKPPRQGVSGHPVTGRWRRTLRGKEIVWARGAGVSLIATLLWADPDLAFARDGDAIAARVVAGQALDATEFPTPVAPLLKRPVVQRARDSVSALDLMTAGGLDEAVKNREATTADAVEITAAMQEAVAACATRRWQLDIPAGDFHTTGALTSSLPLSIKGSGIGRTRLLPAADQSGIVITNAALGPVEISDLTILSASPTGVGRGIDISYEPGVTIRNGREVVVRDVVIDGVTQGSTGFERGLSLSGVVTGTIDNFKAYGRLTNALGPYVGRGISIDGPNDPVIFRITNTQLSAFETAIRFDGVEGVYINNLEVPTCRRGIVSRNTDLEPGIFVYSSHINALHLGIDFENVEEFLIQGVLFYFRFPSEADNFAGFRIGTGCRNGMLRDNVFFFNAPGSGQPAGILLDGCQWISVQDNTFETFSNSVGVDVLASATSCDIGKNMFRQVGLRYRNASTTTTFETMPDYAGSLDAILPNARRNHQVYLLGAASGGPTGAALAGGILDMYSRDGNTAHQVLQVLGDTRMYRRRYTGGAWTAWRFVEFSGVPA